MIVLDASAALELLLGTPTGRRVAKRIRPAKVTLHAPHLIDLEVTQALKRYVFAGAIDAATGRRALRDLRDLDLERYPHDVFLSRIWSLKDNLTAYDAAYVSLAEALEAPLLTSDAKLSNVPGMPAVIELA